MKEACTLVIGRHDFAAFGHVPNRRKTGYSTSSIQSSSIRTMFQAGCTKDERLISLSFTANAFLTGMVRKLVGTILLVGTRYLTIDDFLSILHEKDYMHSGPLVPARGLYLVHVTYPDYLRGTC
jgi:tRNA pseudouridine38-40 synthase